MTVPIALGVAKKLAGKLKSKAAKEAEREAHIRQVYDAAIAGFGMPPGIATKGAPNDPLKWLNWAGENVASVPAKLLAKQLYHDAMSKQHAAAHQEATGGIGELEAFSKTPGGARVIGAVATAALRRGRTRRSYIDQYGRRRYRRAQRPIDEEEMSSEDDAGATIDQGGDQEEGGFFTEDVSQLKGGKAVGAAALVAAAGAGSYFVTKNLLDHLGAGARSRAEQRTQATLAFHQALEDYKTEHGSYPSPAMRKQMKNTWAAQLAAIQGGQIQQLYDSFISTYGDEEE